MNTIMSDQLCEKCQEHETEPGNTLCSDCISEAKVTNWAPTRSTLTDLDELENRSTDPQTGIVPRLLWWLAFILIAACIILITVDKVNMPFLDNIPAYAELRDNCHAIASWWDDGIKKLGETIGM